jgi:hypothetical protein
MSNWEAFKKYFGVRGVLAIVLVGGYVFMTAKGIPVPDAYGNLTFGVVGLMLGKNGGSYISAANNIVNGS